MLAEIIFCLSALAMLHTYLFYPIVLFAVGSKKRLITRDGENPELTVICAAYNEEKVIEEKIHSTFKTNYPPSKITFLIGTDNCSDRTVEIIKRLQVQYPRLKLREFTQRTGKIGILNELCKEAGSPVLVMTDANVFFTPTTLDQLTKHFSDPGTVLVAGRVEKRAQRGGAVTQSELRYMNFENRLKSDESHAFRVVMGAEGGCYAFRKEIFRKIPPHFIADDFFITCLALRTKKNVLFEENAIAYEDLATDTRGEFRRKARIATGNFQNLFYFKDLLLRFWTATAFCFFSHKVLRWVTPFLFLLNLAATLFLLKICIFFPAVACFELFLIVLPMINFVLVKIGAKIKPLVAISHFMMMNAALAVGFFRYCGGVKSSVWEPVKR